MPFVCVIEGAAAAKAAVKPQGREAWRIVLAFATLIFVLTNAFFISGSSAEYEGYTSRLLAVLRPPAAGATAVKGPAGFAGRTELALALLESRAPDYYKRIQEQVLSIEYMPGRVLKLEDGHTLNLERMGAVSFPAQRRVFVLMDTAFPSGLENYWDRDIYSYAGVLVHELRHIELHHSGQAPGGWQEELLCEEAAYDALKAAAAPGGVLERYEQYLANPQAGRYQHWYDWYEQQD
jgi:hypothetical protein